MTSRFILMLAIVGALLRATQRASAHPHVWVTMHTELVYAAGRLGHGRTPHLDIRRYVLGLCDDGISLRRTGLSRRTLQPLAKVNVDSLKDFDYFTYAKVDGQRVKDAFAEPADDYWLDYDAKTTLLTLHFTLPFKTPVKAKKSLQIEVYDPTFFVDFAMAKDDPVKLAGAPAQCKVATEKPPDLYFPTTLRLDQALVTSEANIGMGASFSNKITVTCP